MNAAALAIVPSPVALRQQRFRARLQKALRVSIPKLSPQPSVSPQTDREATVTSFQNHSSGLETLGMRVAGALRRRVGGGRSITVKQLAYAIQVSETTVWNLLSGNKEPRGDTLLKLLTFFDSAFANEILGHTGCTVVKLSDHQETASAIKDYMAAQERILRALGTGTEE